MKRTLTLISFFVLVNSIAFADSKDSCKRFAKALRLNKSCTSLYDRADALDCTNKSNAIDEMTAINKECQSLSAGQRQLNEEKAAKISANVDKFNNLPPEEKAKVAAQTKEKLKAAREAREAKKAAEAK